MNAKTGQPYEDLVQAIFQLILGQKDIPNIVVERNVTLQGRNATHQIDIYWKFDVGGVSHAAIVQAKDWQKPVDQLHLLAFTKVLEDLPGQPRGIFVTRTGYQSGAKEWALAHGILLYELREIDYPSPLSIPIDGWARVGVVPLTVNGFVTTRDNPIDPGNAFVLGFAWEVFTPYFSEIKYTVSANWLEAEYPSENIDSLKEIKLPVVPPHESRFFDDKGNAVNNLQSVRREITAGLRKDGIEKKQVNYVFESEVFIETGCSRIPKVKISGFSTEVEMKRTQELRRVKMSNFVQLVLHQVNSNKIWWFAATPQVVSKLSQGRKTRTKRVPRRADEKG
jgi:hypothetical protein